MSIEGIKGLAKTLSYYSIAQETMANNLANVSSDAFKALRVTALESEAGGFPIPVQELDLTQGSLRTTGRALDLAIDGEGFLAVRTPSGDRLTRGGGLQLDGSGRITDRNGNPLLDGGGEVIAVPPGEMVIAEDGTISVDGAVVASLRIVNADAANLLSEGGGRFQIALPLEELPAATGRIRQGMLEDANVDGVRGMMDMMLIQRAYATNIDAMRTLDGVLESVVSEVGRI